ncbi:MAG TPA: phage holin family protein [Dongiaceae bacterium]|nr:phage holin family protein [Dongiaceae bacterium]
MSLRADERHSMSVHATDGIVQSGRRILAILVSMVRTRLSLLSVELMEEKSRIWLMLVLTALALLFASMALLMLSMLVIVAFWDENRLLAIGGLLVFYLLAAGVSLLVLRHKAKIGSPLFSTTLRELSRDTDELEGAIEADEVDFDVETRHRA